MSTEQCRRLREAYLYARNRRTTKVIVLAGGADFFSNGIHLNVIEAAADQAEESWYNLHAIDDIVREILETDSHITISALSGDAAAGGVPFAVAADHVVAREDVVLNPYYQHMGGLYGSEYWTYVLPRRVGDEIAAELTSAPFNPIGTRRAVEIGLLDGAFGDTAASFRAQVQGLAERLARHPDVAPLARAEARDRAHATSRPSRWPPTGPRRWPSRTSASSARTAATTWRAAASCTRPAPRAPCRSPPERADPGSARGDQGPSSEASAAR